MGVITTLLTGLVQSDLSLAGATVPPDDIYVVNSTCGTLTPYPQGTTSPTAGTPVGMGTNSQYAALTPDGSVALATNTGSNTVSVVDLVNSVVLANLSVGLQPEGIAVSPDGNTAYVVDTSSHDIRPINVAARTVGGGAIAGVSPYGIAIAPNGKTAYVTDSASAVVLPISLPSLSIGTPIPVGANPKGIAVTPDGSTLYVVNSGSATVTPITTSTNTPLAPVAVGMNPLNIAISPDGTTAVVTNGNPVGTPTVTVLNLTANPATAPPTTQTISLSAGDVPAGVAWTPDMSTIWVSSTAASVLIPISVTHTVSGNQYTVDAPVTSGACGPVGIVATPDQTPVAHLAVTSFAITTGGSVTLDASSSTVAYGQVALYGYIWGDGQEERTPSPTDTHTYTQPGRYVASVVELDSAGTGPNSAYTGQSMIRNAPQGPGGLVQDIAQAVVTVSSLPVTGSPIPADGPVIFVDQAGSNGVAPIGLPAAGAPSSVPPVGTPISVGNQPGWNAITPDGNVTLVSNYQDSSIQTIMTCNNSGTDTFNTGNVAATGPDPAQIAISPIPVSVSAAQIQWSAYVADFGGSDIRHYIVTEPMNGCVATIQYAGSIPASLVPSGASPYGIAITPDGSTAYVSDYGLETVTPINLATGQPGAPILVGIAPEGIAITPDGKTVYVVDSGSNAVTPITTSNNLPGLQIPVGTAPNAIAISSNGLHAFVTDATSKAVTDIALNSCGNMGCSTSNIALGVAPTGVAITADASTAWVASCSGNMLVPISLQGDVIRSAQVVQGLACPVGVAITPDQAAAARLSQHSYTTIPNSTLTFDASSSTVKYGQIVLYGWIFGDGTLAQTTSPIETHTYTTPGTYTMTVIELDTAGTLFSSAFTGQSMSRWIPNQSNGQPQDQSQAFVKVTSSASGGPIPIAGTTGLLYTTNVGAGTVSALGISNSGPFIGPSVAAGAGPVNIAVTPDGFGAVVTDFSGNTVTPMAICPNSGSGNFSFTPGGAISTNQPEPVGVAISSTPVSTSGSRTTWNIYVAEYGGAVVEQFQLTVDSSACTAAVSRVAPLSASLIPVGQAPYGIVITGNTAYVSNSGSATVTPISLSPAAVGGQTGAPIPVGRNPEGLAVTGDGSTVVVANSGSNTVTRIDTSNNTPSAPLTVGGSSPDYVAITPDGTWAYVTDVGSATVTAVNLTGCSVTTCPESTIALPSVGYGVAVSPDGSTVWIASLAGGDLIPISVATNTIESNEIVTGLSGPLGLTFGTVP